ncbi:MAG: branched-chain amino acid ABC transporter permease [Candidatus Hecatellales archaeon]|nr:MAG: branched-chain amino acid ABC transporter permease [Candidatus Hecatellales archaeon]
MSASASPLLQKIRGKFGILTIFVVILVLVAVFSIFAVKQLVLYLQIIILGIFLGGLYAVAAISFALIYGVMRFFNLAHGELLIIGAYVSYWVFVLAKVDPLLSIVLSFAALSLIGLIYCKGIASPIIKMGVNPTLIASFGLALALQGLMILFWSGDPRALVTDYSKISVQIGPIIFPLMRLIVLILGIVILALVHFFLTKTYLGRACRAISQDREAAEMVGINAERIYLLSFIIACGLAGIAGTLIGLVYSFEPTMGLRIYLLKSIAVVVLGGVGSISGVLAGGLTLGIAEVLGAHFIGEGYRHAIAFIIFLIVLIFKPAGLFGRVTTL